MFVSQSGVSKIYPRFSVNRGCVLSLYAITAEGLLIPRIFNSGLRGGSYCEEINWTPTAALPSGRNQR